MSHLNRKKYLERGRGADIRLEVFDQVCSAFEDLMELQMYLCWFDPDVPAESLEDEDYPEPPDWLEPKLQAYMDSYSSGDWTFMDAYFELTGFRWGHILGLRLRHLEQKFGFSILSLCIYELMEEGLLCLWPSGDGIPEMADYVYGDWSDAGLAANLLPFFVCSSEQLCPAIDFPDDRDTERLFPGEYIEPDFDLWEIFKNSYRHTPCLWDGLNGRTEKKDG